MVERNNSRSGLTRSQSGPNSKLSLLWRSESYKNVNSSDSAGNPKREFENRSNSVGEILRKKNDDSHYIRKRPTSHNNELLQSALSQNYNLQRVNSANNLTEPEEIRSKLEQFNLRRRWDSSSQDIKELGSVGISPITIIQDEYNTRMPKQAYDFRNPDNTFKSLSRQNSSSDVSLYTAEKEEPIIGKESSGTKVYMKMNKYMHLATNGIHSLISQKSKSTLNSQSSHVSNIQSESDDESEDEFLDHQNEPTFVDSPKIEIQTDFSYIQKEIEEFQKTFVDKFNDKGLKNGNLTPKLSRVQKKLLDYKDLYKEDQGPSSAFMNQVLWDTTGSGFELKIQNEKLINQYHSIRVRFSNRITEEKNVQQDSGLIGCIKRVYSRNLALTEKKEYFEDQLNNNENVTLENKNQYLQDLWNSEYASLFPDKDEDNIENSESFQSSNNFQSSISRINMSDIAKSINIR